MRPAKQCHHQQKLLMAAKTYRQHVLTRRPLSDRKNVDEQLQELKGGAKGLLSL